MVPTVVVVQSAAATLPLVGSSVGAPGTVGSSVAAAVGASVGPAVGAAVVGATVGADVSGIDVASRLELLKPADEKLTLSAASNESMFMTGTDKSVPAATGTDVSTTTFELRLTGFIVTLLSVMSKSACCKPAAGSATS